MKKKYLVLIPALLINVYAQGILDRVAVQFAETVDGGETNRVIRPSGLSAENFKEFYSTNINGGVLSEGSNLARDLTERFAEVVNVLDYGEVGTSDDSAIVQLAASAAEGKTLLFPPGTYTFSGVFATNVYVYALKGANFIMEANTTDDMLIINGGVVDGGNWDGNKANQNDTHFHSVISFWGEDKCVLKNAKISNYNFAAVESIASGITIVEDNEIYEGAKHGGVLNDKLSTAIHYIATGLSDVKPHFIVRRNYIKNTTLPSVHGENPGGIIVQGFDANNVYPRTEITYNYIENAGQDILGNHIASIHVYEDVLDGIVANNIIYNSRYNAIMIQNSGRIVVENNIITGDSLDSYSNILYDPSQRSQADGVYQDIKIVDNILNDDTAVGITVQGVNTTARNALVQGNIIDGHVQGINIDDVERLFVKDNMISTVQLGASTGAGIYVEGASGHIYFEGNDVTSVSQHAFYAPNNVDTAYLHFDNNNFVAETSGYYALYLRGAEGLYMNSGEYTGVNVSIYTGYDASTNHIGEMFFDWNRNKIRAGTYNFNATHVDRWIGPVSGTVAPEGVYSATVGTIYHNLASTPELYIKASGSSNTGWRLLPYNKGAVVSGGNYNAVASDSVIAVDATAGERTIGLPKSTNAVGSSFIVVKYDISANLVHVEAQTGDTLNGGTVTLTNQYDSAFFFNRGLGHWYKLSGSAGGGGSATSPGGSSGEVQYNNGGNFAGASGVTTDGTNLFVTDEAYGVGWDADLSVATKNAIYDKIETLGAGGEVNTASNLGTGTGVFNGKSGVDLQFNSLVAGNKMLITSNANELTIALDTIALGTDTTGNYVADVAGTANEVTVTHTPAEGSTATISLPASIDLGSKTSFEIPNSAAPSPSVFGQLAGDNNLWGASRGSIMSYDGTAITALVGVLASDTPSNGQVLKWNTGGTITWEDDSTGAGGAGTGVIREMWIDAGAFGSYVTGGQVAARINLSGGEDVWTMDSDVDSSVIAKFSMPSAWDGGNIKIKFYWSPVGSDADGGDVRWQSHISTAQDNAAIALDSDTPEVDDAQQTNDAATLHISPAATMTGLSFLTEASRDAVISLVVTRFSSHVNDTLASDVYLWGVKIQYTETTTEPTGW